MDCGTETRVHDKLRRRRSREATGCQDCSRLVRTWMSTWRGKQLDPCVTVHSKLTQNGRSETGRDLGPLDTGLIPGPTSPRATKELEETKRDCVHGHLGPGMDMKTKRLEHNCPRKSCALPRPLHTEPATGQAVEAPHRLAHPPVHTLTHRRDQLSPSGGQHGPPLLVFAPSF